MQSSSKRAFRPVASTPSTAEHYGEKFGIPEDVQNALQTVGMRGRMSVTQGRTFERTQTMPNFQSSQDEQPDWSTGSTSFITDSEAISNARDAIHKEDLRRRELQPYSKTLDESAPRIRGSSPALDDDLYFRSDGIDEDDMEWEGDGSGIMGKASGMNPSGSQTRSKKRRATADPEEDEGDATDVDEVESQDQGQSSGLSLINGSSGTRTSLPIASMSNLDEFPPVFTSPEISQPELFSNPSSSDLKLRPPGLRDEPAGRPTRGMPRMLGKTMSAPVGQLGRFGAARLEPRGTGLKGQGGMQVDDEMEDGFDVSEWAASEEF